MFRRVIWYKFTDVLKKRTPPCSTSKIESSNEASIKQLLFAPSFVLYSALCLLVGLHFDIENGAVHLSETSVNFYQTLCIIFQR
jgi:hypothetical protein